VDINATLVGQMITFAIFVGFTMKFVWPALEKVLIARQEQIAQGLMAAERGHQELEIAQKKAAKQLQETREQIVHMLDQANKQVVMILEDAKREANEERAHIIEAGLAEVEQQRASAKSELQGEIAELVISITEKLLNRTVNQADYPALLAQELEKVHSHG